MTNRIDDLEAIRSQKARYCRLIDTKGFDELPQLFTPDAAFHFFGLDGELQFQHKSRAEFVESARGLFATTRTIHQTHNSEVDFVSDTRARAVWSMEDWHIYAPKDSAPSKTMHGYGFYHDVFDLIDGQWLCSVRDLRRVIVFEGSL